MDLKSLPVAAKVKALVKALDGARRTNEALSRCEDGEAMVDVLLNASAKLGLGLSRRDLMETPPIRDWIWWKNKQALLTIGDNRPRYQQDNTSGDIPEKNATGEDSPLEMASPDGSPARRKRFGLF